MFVNDLFSGPAVVPLFLTTAISAAFMLFAAVKRHPFFLSHWTTALWVFLCCVLVWAIILTVKAFAFRRIRYVFSPRGIRVEGGIEFFSDLVAWQHINDINISASISEQLFSCGTVIIGTHKFGPQFLRYVPNYKELRNYLEIQLQTNLKNARSINPI